MRSVIFILCLVISRSPGAEFSPITDFGPTNEYGAALQRSMRLMATSSPERKQTVKILFYGQSITAQNWSASLANSLRKAFPSAHLIITNFGISGFPAEVLSKTAEADILGFYPDLLIFHDYGSTTDYEKIVATARQRTTADILIQTDHPLVDEDLDEPTNPSAITNEIGDAWRNYVVLPGIAAKYGAELADVRTVWKQYLRTNTYSPTNLLGDNVHLNEHGDFVMEALVGSHLRVDDAFSDASWRNAVTEVPLGRPLRDESTIAITIPFTGNRVDLIFSTNASTAVQVWIDGKKPSEFPELYTFSRTALYPNTVWPTILQIKSHAPLTTETWTATVLEAITNGFPRIRFSLRGSETGEDGEGTSENLFVSNSGRVVIRPIDWLMLLWTSWFYPAVQPLPVGHEIRWESRFYGMDQVLPKIDDRSLENTATVAQGLASGAHTLTLIGSGTSAIEAVRIFNPLARTQPTPPPEIRIESVRVSGGSVTVRASGIGRYVVEGAEIANGPWRALSAPQDERTFTTSISGVHGFLRLRKID